MLLGSQLRQLRESNGITPDQAALEIRASRSKISRLETGRVRVKLRDVTDLLTLYGVHDEQVREGFLALARQSRKPDWWAKYGDVLPDWFEPYLGLESAASFIRSYDAQFFHSLFQTEGYARAVTRFSHQIASTEEIENRVAVRIKRQDLLTRPDSSRIWSVMDESVLRRPIGGRAVMRGQLLHLIEVADLPNVTIQVVPLARSGYAGESGSFAILRFEERDLPDVVYIEQLTSALYLEQRPDVEHYLEVIDRLSGYALTPAATMRLIDEAARQA
jgi:transcriptional regulator with XRE-family HTH domain